MLKDIVKKSILFGIGVVQITKEEIEKFVNELQKDGKLTPEEGKKLVKEVVAEAEKKLNLKDTKKKVNKAVHDSTPATKKDIDDLKRQIKALKK